jgi:hypothetical protein
MEQNTIHINYVGGTGGFFVLWVILLGTDFKCIFNNKTQNLSDISNIHWDINPEIWKSSEVWPNNVATLNSNIRKKLYFNCNIDAEAVKKQQGTKISIYTDASTHYTLSRFKKAADFYKQTELNQMFTDTYNDIKKLTWPNVSTINDHSKLHSGIKEEVDIALIKTYNKTADNIKTEISNFAPPPTKEIIKYNEDDVFSDVGKILKQSDICVKWQELIRSKGSSLLSELGYNTPTQCIDFINHYIKCHPKFIRELMYG